jgi:methionine synthase II (cobalamin-independent)
VTSDEGAAVIDAPGAPSVPDILVRVEHVAKAFGPTQALKDCSFAQLRFVPKGKSVVLGLVTSKKGELEAKDDIKRRIEEASKFVDIDQLCLSPQCGFSSTLEGNSLSRDQQIAKLRLVAETAEEVWGTP